MAEKYTNEPYYNFSAGVNQAVSRLLMANDEVSVIENGELEKVGSIYKARGYEMRGSAVNANYDILGMINAYKSSDGTQKQIVIADDAAESDAYTYNPITDDWTAHNLSLTSGAKAEFASFLDGFFMVNFSDATRWNDLSAWSTSTNVTNAPKAKYIQLYLDRLYTAYVVSGGSTYPSRVIYSDLPTTGSLTWNNSTNYFDVDTDNGDVIKGLGVNASRLLIFKKDSLYRYDTNTLYQVPGCPGTVSQRSVKNIQGYTLYLHDTGIWSYNGTSAVLISRKIQELIDGINTAEAADSCATVIGDHYYLYVGDVSNSQTGFSVDKCLIDYNIAQNAFTWRSLDDTPTVFMQYPDDRSAITYDDSGITYNDGSTYYNGLTSTEQRYYFGTDDGNVFHFNSGNTMNSVAIPFRVETKDYYLGYPSYWKVLQKVIVFTDYAGKGVLVQASCDGGDWISLGRVNKEQTELIFPSGTKCQRVKFRIAESSSGDRFAFEGLDVYFTAQGLIE